MRSLTTKTLIRALLVPSAITIMSLAACEDKGAAEKAGERIDEAVEETGDAIDEAIEEVGDEVDDATN